MAQQMTCAACGDARGMFCPMSDDGEGPHNLVAVIPLTETDREFLRRVAVHYEQGSQER